MTYPKVSSIGSVRKNSPGTLTPIAFAKHLSTLIQLKTNICGIEGLFDKDFIAIVVVRKQFSGKML